MGKQYTEILQEVLSYNRNQRQITTLFLIVAIFLIVVLAIVTIKRLSLSNKIVICIIILSFLIIYGIYCIVDSNYQAKIESDIEVSNFVTYSGIFTHDNYQKDSFFHNVYIYLENGKKRILRFPDYGNHYQIWQNFCDFPLGSFEGTLVYSRTSGIIVDWSIDKIKQ